MTDNEDVDLTLEGHDGPIDVPQLSELNRVILGLPDVGWNGKCIRAASRFIENRVRQDYGLKTNDGESWEWTVLFKADTGQIRVCFPHIVLRTGEEELRKLSRSSAVYTTGVVRRKEIEETLKRLVKRMNDVLNYDMVAASRTRKESPK